MISPERFAIRATILKGQAAALLDTGAPPWLGNPRQLDVALNTAELVHAKALLASRVSKSFSPEQLPKDSNLEKLVTQGRLAVALLGWELENCVGIFHDARIPSLVLKGMDLASRVYSDRTLRPMADIDLCVQPERFDQAVSLLEGAGYARVNPLTKGRFRVELSRGEGFPVVELHSRLLAEDSAEFTREIWDCSLDGGALGLPPGTRVLSSEHCLVYLIRHAAQQHLLESTIWLNDIHLLILKGGPSMGWDKVVRLLRQHRAIAAAWFTFSLLQAEWLTPVSEPVIAELAGSISWVRSGLLRRRLSVDLWFYPTKGWCFTLFSRLLLRDRIFSSIRYGMRRAIRIMTSGEYRRGRHESV